MPFLKDYIPYRKAWSGWRVIIRVAHQQQRQDRDMPGPAQYLGKLSIPESLDPAAAQAQGSASQYHMLHGDSCVQVSIRDKLLNAFPVLAVGAEVFRVWGSKFMPLDEGEQFRAADNGYRCLEEMLNVEGRLLEYMLL